MPFYHEGVFHFYYLIDEDHHQALGGLGGHQWAHAASSDLVEWRHYPLALAITEAEECSICTGSIFYHGGTFYAFHAVRRPDWTQRLGVATSADGITFVKQPVPLHAEPPANYDPVHFRDPGIFYEPESKLFHQLVTASVLDCPIPRLGGCLAHLVSSDLQHWQLQAPFIIPGFDDAPECPDHFEWNGWYYLVFSSHGLAHYRMARSPLGPWQRPAYDLLDGPWARVMKTAAYHDNRRLGAAWIGTRLDDKDNGRFRWGGHAVFRELVQNADGTLGTKFPPEMVDALVPVDSVPLSLPTALPVVGQTEGVTLEVGRIHLQAGEGTAALAFADLPLNARIRLMVLPVESPACIGVRLRESAPFEGGVVLQLLGERQRVELYDAALDPVIGLDGPCMLDIVLKDELIDVCVNERYCLINRCPEQKGRGLTLFCQAGTVVFEGVTVWGLG